MHRRGTKIVLWTCREGMDLKAALDWCNRFDVPIDYVNENPQSHSELWKNDCRKIGADLYIDDKSFNLWHDCRNTQDIIDELFSE